jgi:hypothetical protein
LLPHLLRAGEWFVHSGIQLPNGGVARYYRVELECNHPVSTEITGYAASAFVYLHSVTGEARYLERAVAAARFLTHTAWDRAGGAMPFELDPAEFTYFFDCGMIVRGLVSVWRASGEDGFRDAAVELGRRMATDFASEQGDFHPVLALPGRQPIERDAMRWSRASGCYQLKAAMAWWDLFEATGDAGFRALYERALEFSLRQSSGFLPGQADPLKVMDRLHAFLYFLEGLLPRASEAPCAAALVEGILRVEGLLREIGPRFVRSDVYAQLLRIRLFADWHGAAPLDRQAASQEAEALAGFQAVSANPRIDGGFYFGRKGAEWLPYINPVSTAFAMQALAWWECHARCAQPHRHLLI